MEEHRKAVNRHFTAIWKKRRAGSHGDKCKNPKCGVCHPHKCIGGNHKGRVKKKFIIKEAHAHG